MKQVLDESDHRYWVHLQFKHPHMATADVTEALGIQPDHSWEAGAVPFTANAVWERVSETRGQLDFSEELLDLFEWLLARRDFIDAFTRSGGWIQVQVQLDGRCYTPSVAVPPAVMLTAMELGVALCFGVEGPAKTVMRDGDEAPSA